MGDLDNFNQLMAAGKNREANECLRLALENRREEFFIDLKIMNMPILKFWSYHPGNPDITLQKPPGWPGYTGNEDEPGYAYLLTGWDDVKHALDKFSMESYARISPANKSSFILSEDEPSIHDPRHEILVNALKDPFLYQKMDAAIIESWQGFAGYEPLSDRFDIRVFARTVALRFTGKFFGINENLIFAGRENLELWSELGYENFIWKLHGRHFGEQNPEMHRALAKIAHLVQVSMRIEAEKVTRGYSKWDSNIITRLLSSNNVFTTFGGRAGVVTNIVGLIQGLVDNVMTGTCFALNQMYKIHQQDKNQFDAIRASRFDIDTLVKTVRNMHQLDTPSPFLPRRGRLVDLPSFDSAQYSEEEANQVSIFSCAIGSAIADNLSNPAITDDWDIRMGSGMHKCIGNYIGDELSARMIARILEINPPEITSPLHRRWGWVVKNFEIKNNRMKNYMAVRKFTTNTPSRPRPFSLRSHYTSWPSLIDKSYFGRHLEPADNTVGPAPDYKDDPMQPTIADLTALFTRVDFKPGRSSLLFAFFAQWLTDSFLRTDSRDVPGESVPGKKNTSTHQLDMCQIYGLDEDTATLLRSKQDGKLLTENVVHPETGDARECLPLLFTEGNVKSTFSEIPYIKDGLHEAFLASVETLNPQADIDKIKSLYFATGLERGNSTVGYTALSTLFVLEHNRICDAIKSEISGIEPGINTVDLDERVFQTARMIIIALEIKIIVEEYINHITSKNKDERIFLFDQSFAESHPWYRENWISIEFDLLYQWHSLIPDHFDIEGNPDFPSLLADNELLVKLGFEEILVAASNQAAGEISLRNTPGFLNKATESSLAKSRMHQLRSYNEYRRRFGLAEVKDFAELCDDPGLTTSLEAAYHDRIEDLEFIVGLYAEKPESENDLFGELMTRMVAYDAFTHALTNPLLSNNIWGPDTFTATGMKIIEDTHCLEDILKRNSSRDPADLGLSMDFPKLV